MFLLVSGISYRNRTPCFAACILFHLRVTWNYLKKYNSMLCGMYSLPSRGWVFLMIPKYWH